MDALQDIRVLDISTGVAGPIVGMFLADFGATVVKVEEPTGDPGRDLPGFAMWNRGKLGVIVDPSDPVRAAWLESQAAGADILVTNGTEQLARFGLDSDTLLRTNQRLILTEMPRYLAGYTPWAGGHESGELLSAIGGRSARQYSVSGDPVASVYPTPLYVQGLWATLCSVAALVEREDSGWGQRVTVTGVNALQQLCGVGLHDPDAPDANTSTGPGGFNPIYRRLLAGDGKWFGCGALGAKFEPLAMGALGLTDELNGDRLKGQTANLIKPENVAWVRELVAAAALQKTRAEWLEKFDELGIPCGPLQDRDEWLDHPQIRAIGMRAEVDDPERGPVVMPGVPLWLTSTPGEVRGPAPLLGQHDGEVPTWEAQPRMDGEPPVRPGPLHDYTVLNSGWFVAVPYSGSLLAQLGANVVKVEPPKPDGFREGGYFWNRGMTSLIIDLQSPEGLAAFHRITERSDAFIDGLRPGVTDRLGIDYDSLKKINPTIVTASLSGYGEGGPLGDKAGVDMVMQVMSGMMKAEGGDGEPVATTNALIDTTAAAAIALAVTLGLFHRARTGEGQRTWEALAATSCFLQGGEMTRFAGREPARVGGTDFKGPGAYDRIYRTSDGWVRVEAARGVDGEAAVLRAGIGVDDGALAVDPAKAIEEALADVTAERAVEAFNSAGLAAVLVRKGSQVVRDPRLLEAQYLHVRPSDDGRFICVAGPMAKFSRTGLTTRLDPPGFGEHTRKVLESAGFSESEIADLLGTGAVVQGGPVAHIVPTPYR